MPKVYLSAADREEARRQKADNEIRGIIGRYLRISGERQKDLAARMGMSPATLSRRISNPGDMTLAELRGILKTVGASTEEMAKCL